MGCACRACLVYRYQARGQEKGLQAEEPLEFDTVNPTTGIAEASLPEETESGASPTEAESEPTSTETEPEDSS